MPARATTSTSTRPRARPRRRASFCTRRPGRTSTAPRRTRSRRARVNVEGTRNVVALGAPVVYFSTDYVFDGAKGRAVRRVGRAESALGVRAHEARRGARGPRGLDRPLARGSSAGRATTSCGRCSRSARAGRGVGGGRPARLADLRRAPGGGDDGSCSSFRTASTTWPPTATARGPSSPRRSSRRRASTAACAGSRPRSSAGRPRARPTRSSGANEARRSSRTGAKAFEPASPVSKAMSRRQTPGHVRGGPFCLHQAGAACPCRDAA